MRLIFIHGRDQQGKDQNELKNLWIKSFEEGLSKSSLIVPSNIEIIFPFYGDILHDFVINKARKRSFDIRENPEIVFFAQYFSEIYNVAGFKDATIESLKSGKQTRDFLNTLLGRKLMEFLDQQGIGGVESIRNFTYDVFIYLTVGIVKDKIENFILELMGNDPCVIVAHSLGTIIGYNVLNRYNLNVKKFITLGSPLGVEAIKKHLKRDLIVPHFLTDGWFNAFDKKDYISLYPLDKAHFPVDHDITNYNEVTNNTSNHHGIEGYLNDKVVAKIIYDSIIKYI